MKSRPIVRTARPMKGLVAFARAWAMASLGTCEAAVYAALPTSYPPLDRNEDSLHPGEGGAVPA